MKQIIATLVVCLLVGAAIAFYFFRYSAEQAVVSPSTSPTEKPSFALTGEILSVDSNNIKLLYEVKAAVGSNDYPQYDTRLISYIESTKVVRLVGSGTGGGDTEVAATTVDLTYGQIITVQWAEKDGPALFPQKITILP